MSTHQGGTDSAHRITLPSTIQAVWWGVREGEVGGEAPLLAETLFVGDGAGLKAEVRTRDGKTVGTVTGSVGAGRWSGVFTLPDRAEGEVYFEAELPKHGLKARSGLLRVHPARLLANAKWSAAEVRRGDVVKLTVDAREFADGTRVALSIYENDADGGHDFITELTAAVENEKVGAEWAYDYPDDTAEIPTDDELKPVNGSYAHPEYFFVARAAGKEAKSGLLRFKDSIELELYEDGEQVTNREYTLYFADGTERKGALDGKGTAQEENLPPGPVRVDFAPRPPDADDGKGGGDGGDGTDSESADGKGGAVRSSEADDAKGIDEGGQGTDPTADDGKNEV